MPGAERSEASVHVVTISPSQVLREENVSVMTDDGYSCVSNFPLPQEPLIESPIQTGRRAVVSQELTDPDSTLNTVWRPSLGRLPVIPDGEHNPYGLSRSEANKTPKNCVVFQANMGLLDDMQGAAKITEEMERIKRERKEQGLPTRNMNARNYQDYDLQIHSDAAPQQDTHRYQKRETVDKALDLAYKLYESPDLGLSWNQASAISNKKNGLPLEDVERKALKQLERDNKALYDYYISASTSTEQIMQHATKETESASTVNWDKRIEGARVNKRDVAKYRKAGWDNVDNDGYFYEKD